jgi:hypothetical protein
MKLAHAAQIVLRCDSPLLAHRTRHGRRPARRLTGGKPASRKPLRQSRFGAPRAAARAAQCRRRAALLDVPCRCAGTDAGGAIGREALDAATVASGASIKPGEPGEALHREALDAGDVPRSSTCRAAAPGSMPVVRSAATPSMPARWRAAPLPREALDAGDVPLDVPRRVLSWRARTDGVFWDRE